jgi:protein associated with RNAse G/E
MILQNNISAVLSMCRSYGMEFTIGHTSYFCEDARNVKTLYYIWDVEVAPNEYIKRDK